ncbi:SusC/RagA family TonB-linked outer membrane protein [Paraflavisolibacter sp. H34]|uniref:SusC/RagA family TonB-linked outer membrane protein n=1 Tax=Huijunlia imazamoxiresistens TaxID=3127457 RepID=UPI00301B109F
MRKLLSLTLGVALLCNQALAQNRTVSGTVTDSKGNPLPNVSVLVKGAKVGTTTGPDGRYTIALPANARVLVFSSIDMKANEVQVDDQSTINTALQPNEKNLQEVVVTALGITKDKRSLGYTTHNLKGEDLADKGEVNLVNVLQGKVAGLDITGASGAAGASANINIRGIQSFTGNNQPLFVVDGVPISNDVDRTGNTLMDAQPANRALDLNLNDIESVNVLKGPAAAALYGLRAASGAIMITTKKGTAGKGKARVTVASSYSQQQVSGLPEFQNEYGGGSNGLYDSTSTFSWGPKFGSTPTLSNGLILSNGQTVNFKAYPDNIASFFETGSTFDNSVNVNGGDAKQNYNLSVANTNTKGILPNSKLNRTNVGFKFNTPLTEKLSFGGSVNYIVSQQNGITQGNGATSAMFQLFSVPRSLDLEYYKNNYKKANGTNNWPLSTTRDNPYFAAYENPVTSNLNRTMGNVKLDYNVLSWLNVAYRLGMDAYTDRRKKVSAVGSFATTNGEGRVLEDNFFRSELNGDLLITAKKDNIFIKGLNANVLLGQNINDRKYQNTYVQGDSLSIPGFYNVANAARFSSSGETTTRQRLLGYYGQMSLAYNNYLFLELTGRVDQTSTLPKGNNTFFYPAAAASFVFTDAVKNVNWGVLSYGKIKANVARVGKDAAPYKLESVYEVAAFGNNVAQLLFPFGTTPGRSLETRIGNKGLTPEFTTSYEAGFNIGFLRNRINLDATYFYTSSTDQIVDVGIPASTGFMSLTSNVGEMTNKGVELLLNATPVSGKNFTWDVTANFTRIRNKVESIGNGITSFFIPGNRFTGAVPTIYEGQPYGVIVGNKFQRSPDGQILINGQTGTPFGTIAGQIIADPNRDFQAGLTNSLKYKKVSLSFLVDYKQGGDIMSWGITSFRALGALKETAVDRELPRVFPGVIQTSDGKYIPNNIQIPAQTYWNSMGSATGAAELGIFDATTLRLREVSVGVDIPGSFHKTKVFSNARLVVYGRNLLYYAPNAPFDPEVNTQGAGNQRGLELQSTPAARSYGASLRLTL